jgi:FMN phosphatase YigB (HAD superfamily)
MVTKNTVIFDIDGTLADGSHRVHHVRNKPKNWVAYNRGMADDDIHQHVYEVYNSLYQASGFDIYIVSGREDQFRAVTEEWLRKNGVTGYRDLFMRKTGDYRSDDIVKEEILLTKFDKNDIVCVFDDRPRVIRMWRKHGIPVFDCGDGVEF